MSTYNEFWWFYLYSIPIIFNLTIITYYFYHYVLFYKDPLDLLPKHYPTQTTQYACKQKELPSNKVKQNDIHSITSSSKSTTKSTKFIPTKAAFSQWEPTTAATRLTTKARIKSKAAKIKSNNYLQKVEQQNTASSDTVFTARDILNTDLKQRSIDLSKNFTNTISDATFDIHKAINTGENLLNRLRTILHTSIKAFIQFLTILPYLYINVVFVLTELKLKFSDFFTDFSNETTLQNNKPLMCNQTESKLLSITEKPP